MRDIVYNVFDIISYFVQGMLLVNLLKETQPRFPFKNIIVLRYCWDSMWQSRFFCTILSL